MFRSRYVPNTNQRNYIRQRYNSFNISSTLNERNFRANGKYRWYLSYYYKFIFSINIPILLEDEIVARNEHVIDIYDEDEELIPAIDTENEEIGKDENEVSEDENEVSEDGTEIEGEYERMMTEFNESEEDEED